MLLLPDNRRALVARMIRLLLLGAALFVAPVALNAQAAKPSNPNGFAKQIVGPDARDGGAGDTVPTTAKSGPQALSNAIKGAKAAVGSRPTPPGRN
jgi:hypothetical protein